MGKTIKNQTPKKGPSFFMNISENLNFIKKEIQEICQKSQRKADSVTLIAVSKTKPVSMVDEALKAGQEHFGENYVQELLEKYEFIKNRHIHWHFIGHLQRRKVKDIVGKIDLIHSVDSIDLMQEINKRAQEKNILQNVLIQINLAKEETKGGIFEENVISFFKNINPSFNHVRITGLMTLPPFFEDPEKARPYFKKLRELKEEINKQNIYPYPLTELSMGMSHDYAVAIEEEATIIRVGTKIFGER